MAASFLDAAFFLVEFAAAGFVFTKDFHNPV